MDPAQKAEVNRLRISVTHQLNKWKNDKSSFTLELLDPEDQLLWKVARRVMRIPTPSPTLVTPGGLALSDSEKAAALADNLEAQFQPVNDPSELAGIEDIYEAMRTYSSAYACEHKLTNTAEVQDAIRCVKVGKAPSPNVLPNRTQNYPILSVVSLLVVLFDGAFESRSSRQLGNAPALFPS